MWDSYECQNEKRPTECWDDALSNDVRHSKHKSKADDDWQTQVNNDQLEAHVAKTLLVHLQTEVNNDQLEAHVTKTLLVHLASSIIYAGHQQMKFAYYPLWSTNRNYAGAGLQWCSVHVMTDVFLFTVDNYSVLCADWPAQARPWVSTVVPSWWQPWWSWHEAHQVPSPTHITQSLPTQSTNRPTHS